MLSYVSKFANAAFVSKCQVIEAGTSVDIHSKLRCEQGQGSYLVGRLDRSSVDGCRVHTVSDGSTKYAVLGKLKAEVRDGFVHLSRDAAEDEKEAASIQLSRAEDNQQD